MRKTYPVPMILALLCLSVTPLVAADLNSDGSDGNDAFGHFTLFNTSLAVPDPNAQNQGPSGAGPQPGQTPVALPRTSTVQPSPLTARGKWEYYLKSTYGPGSLAYTAFAASIKQARGTPDEWGGGMEGYGRRYASAFGHKVINRTVRTGLQVWWHEDPRFQLSNRSGIWPRTLYAASQAFWVHKDDGGTRIGYSRFIGHFSAAYISRQWHPDRYQTTGDYVAAGLTSIGIDAAKNVFKEFWPDVKRKLPF